MNTIKAQHIPVVTGVVTVRGATVGANQTMIIPCVDIGVPAAAIPIEKVHANDPCVTYFQEKITAVDSALQHAVMCARVVILWVIELLMEALMVQS